MTGTPENLALVAGGKAAARRFAFANAVLDERSLELLVQGQPAELEPKPLEVLRHLLAHAGEVVTKDELLAAVWPGRILSETVLTKCIARLRDVLGDDGQQVIKTVHGYGYRLLAPVRVEVSAPAITAPQFNFKRGDHPPQRPLWSLVERLGQGSHGEAWLVRHDKTREQRVYKFAPDAAALHALKREITLYRLLHDAMGDAAPCISALDWNLEESPYFLELEYAPGGSLLDWVQARNGLGAVPLATRLEIAAQAAECLAAAHSMGVLHKDLKPSNILVVSPPDAPVQVKLGDFGSGGVLDEGRLSAMGITRMGFTQTIKAGLAGGTPLYLAPEVIAGQPATVQADIYAVGVVLYQLLVGDLWRPLASGWEQDIEDELLREDIAYAVEGHVERRLGTAALLAQRLRTLEQRRAEREAERSAQTAADRQRLEMQRVLARRGWVRATIVVLVIGLASSLTLSAVALKARNSAAEAAATSAAVTEFLSKDMFSQISSERPLKDLRLREVIDGAAARVGARFANRPLTAAEVHVALGASYRALDDAAAAREEFDLALALFEEHGALGSEAALEAAAQDLTLRSFLGDYSQTGRYRDIRDLGQAQLGAAHPKVMALSRALARIQAFRGSWETAAAEYRDLLAAAGAQPFPDAATLAAIHLSLGTVNFWLAEYAASERELREAVSRYLALYGEQHLEVAGARTYLAQLLVESGRHAEAEGEALAALSVLESWAPNQAAGYLLFARLVLGRVRFEQNRLDEAQETFTKIVAALEAHTGPEADQSVIVRLPLADLLERRGQLPEAAVQIDRALASVRSMYGDTDHPVGILARAMKARVLVRLGRFDEAAEVLGNIDAVAISGLPERHPVLAQLRHAQGLSLQRNNAAGARAALEESLAILVLRYGPDHRQVRAVREDLGRLRPAARA